jgi:hypothetical protein
MKNVLVTILFVFFLSSFAFSQNQTIVYVNNFDSTLTGWTSQNLGFPSSPSNWRLTDSISYSQPYSFVCSDPQTYLYPEGTFDALISPQITLPTETQGLRLEFRFIANLGFNGFIDSSDHWYIEISEDDGQTWELFSNEKNIISGSSWLKHPDYYNNTQEGDLTQFAGSTVKFRFVLKDILDGLVGPGLFIDDLTILSLNCDPDQYEPNNSTVTAYNINYGDSIFAEICPSNDNDIFSFTAQQGDFVRVYQLVNSIPRPTIYIFDQNMNVVFNNFYFDDMRFFAQSTGTYYIWVTKGIFQQFATQYNFSLELLSPNPDVLSVSDVPDDQGLQVRIVWKASYYDPPTGNNNPTGFYAIWRQVGDSLDQPIIKMNGLNNYDFNNSEFMNNSIFEYDNILWDYVAQVPAVSDRPFVDYSFVAPTLYDNVQTAFMICAVPKPGYQIPTLWGAPKSGTSIDNMMPEFLSFGILPGQNEVTLNWNVDRIIHHDLMGFKLYRHLNTGFVPSESNLMMTLSNQHTSFTDNTIQPGKNYFYMIEAIDDAGNSAWSTELSTSITGIETQTSLPKEYALDQNYPNPFNPATTINYQIPLDANISLKIYDVLGNEVAELVNEFKTAGYYEVKFNAGKLTSGVYFYRIESDNFTQTRKMLLMK